MKKNEDYKKKFYNMKEKYKSEIDLYKTINKNTGIS